MVGRNAPCPCGSGKKYKKCCADNESGAVEQLVDEELTQVLLSYPEQLFTNKEHFIAMENLLEQWENKLGEYLEEEQIESLVFDYYIFFNQREQWSRHVLKAVNGTIRSKTRTTITQWQQPIVLVGKVIGEKGDYYEIEEVLGHQIYHARKSVFHHVEVKDIILTIALRDTREIENGLYLFSEMIGVPDRNGEMMAEIQQLAESSGVGNLNAFFDQYMLDVYHLMTHRKESSVPQIIENELTEREQAVCHLLMEELELFEVPQEEIEVAQMIAITYMQKGKPVFRKPEIIAAAVFKALENYGILAFTIDFSQKEVAHLFGISVAAMAKHIEPIEDIIELMVDEIATGQSIVDSPGAAYYIGTDPQMTERVNWEMACRMELAENDSLEDLQQFLNENVNERFIPKGKEQRAQAYAYDAYDQEDEDARVRLAHVAYFTNPDNVDALLLRAERAETSHDAKKDYARAIEMGKLTFDKDFDESPWAFVQNRPYMRALFNYGIILFEDEQFGEALGYFQQLVEMNPNDNQGARHLAIAAAIHDGQYAVANRLQQQFTERPTDRAVYRYLQWFFDMKQGRESDLLGEALDLNDLVIEIIKENIPKYPFPKKMSIAPGSLDEALYISFLLWPSGERSL